MTNEEFKKFLEEQKTETLKEAKVYADSLSESGVEGLEAKFNKLSEKLTEDNTKALDEFIAKRKMEMPGLKDELKKSPFKWAAVVNSLLDPNKSFSKDAGREETILREYAESLPSEARSGNANTGVAGGYLIPDEATNEIIELAIAQMPLMTMGPRVLRGLRGEVHFPKVTARPTAYWVDEEEAPTESDTTFGELILSPHTLGAFSKISRKLIHMSNGLADTTIKQELANAIALKLEQDLLEALSNNKHPTGLVNIAGLSTAVGLADNGERFRVDKAASMMNVINVANLLKPNSNGGLLMRPEVLSGMKRERVVQYSGQAEAAGMPVMNPLVNTKVLEDLLGVKIGTTTLLSNTVTRGNNSTCSNVIAGAFEQMLIGFWEGFELTTSAVAGDSSGSAMTQRQIWVVAFQDVDMKLRNPAAFTVAGDAQTVEGSW